MTAETPDPQTSQEITAIRTHGVPVPPAVPEEARACLMVIQGRALGQLHALLDGGPLVLGRGAEADLVLDDAGVSRQHARIEPAAEGFRITDLGSKNGVFVNGEQVEARDLKDGDRIQLGSGTVLKFRIQDPLEEAVQRRLYESATRDPLTGAYNRRYLTETLEAEFAYAHRHKAALSLVLMDLDHFKALNDRLGHLAGDQALRATVEAAVDELRTEDVVARYGGEEFVLLLRGTDGPRARLTADRIRERLAGLELAYEGTDFRITASFGVATFHKGNLPTPTALVAAADAALYKAKHKGRNRVESAG